MTHLDPFSREFPSRARTRVGKSCGIRVQRVHASIDKSRRRAAPGGGDVNERDDHARATPSTVRVARTARSGYVWSVTVSVGDSEEEVREAAEVAARIEAELAGRYGREQP
jgi:hypothetical protein